VPAAQQPQASGERRVGLVLGGGGARGWAHLGVLRQLDRLRLPIFCVAGCSAGAVVGAVLAAGRRELLDDLAHHLDWRKAASLLLEIGLPRSGLLTGRHVERFLGEVIGTASIEQLQLPFAAVATDLESRAEVVLNSGPVVAAIRASISLPGILTPARQQGRYLVDGGLVNPLPVSVARAMGATVVVAVDVNLRPGRGCHTPPTARTAGRAAALASAHGLLEGTMRRLPRLQQPLEQIKRRWIAQRATPSIFDVLTMTTRMIENSITNSRLLTDPPDILIQPAVGDIATLDFSRVAQIIAAGEAAARECEARLRALAATGRGR
jgi:NTE family protein